jgi:hypothetical protein
MNLGFRYDLSERFLETSLKYQKAGSVCPVILTDTSGFPDTHAPRSAFEIARASGDSATLTDPTDPPQSSGEEFPFIGPFRTLQNHHTSFFPQRHTSMRINSASVPGKGKINELPGILCIACSGIEVKHGIPDSCFRETGTQGTTSGTAANYRNRWKHREASGNR